MNDFDLNWYRSERMRRMSIENFIQCHEGSFWKVHIAWRSLHCIRLHLAALLWHQVERDMPHGKLIDRFLMDDGEVDSWLLISSYMLMVTNERKNSCRLINAWESFAVKFICRLPDTCIVFFHFPSPISHLLRLGKFSAQFLNSL